MCTGNLCSRTTNPEYLLEVLGPFSESCEPAPRSTLPAPSMSTGGGCVRTTLLATRSKRAAFSKNAGLLRGVRGFHHLDARSVGVDDGVFRTVFRQHSSALLLGGEGRRERGRQELAVGLFLAQTCHNIWLKFFRARRWTVEVECKAGVI